MKGKQGIVITAVLLFAAGIAVGGYCSVRTPPEIIYEYFTGNRGGLPGIQAGTAALNAVFVWAVLFFSAFFRFGVLTSMLTVLMKGFTNGFAITAALRIYAARGLLLSLQELLYAPLVIFFAALVCDELMGDERNGFVLKGVIMLPVMVLAAVFGTILSYIAGKYFLPVLQA